MLKLQNKQEYQTKHVIICQQYLKKLKFLNESILFLSKIDIFKMTVAKNTYIVEHHLFNT